MAPAEGQPTTAGRARPASWHRVPPTAMISVQHPFVVKNMDAGLKTLGGAKAIAKAMASRRRAALPLFPRPADPMCNPLPGPVAVTNTLVLKLTVPKRTGRKRKRPASDVDPRPGAWEGGGHGATCSLARQDDPACLRRSLRDHPQRYTVEAVGVIKKTFRYRELADYAHATTNGPFFKRVKDSILSFEYDKLKEFQLDPSRGVQPNTELIPPPITGHMSIPFNYAYLQNPAVKLRVDASGEARLENTQIPHKLLTQMLTHGAARVPTGPHPDLPPLETLSPRAQRFVEQLRRLLEERPLWSRRALTNKTKIPTGLLRSAWQYVGYLFRSGPWREALVRFGVDPRTDPKYRIYQTLMFQIASEDVDKVVGAPGDDDDEEEDDADGAGEDGDDGAADGGIVSRMAGQAAPRRWKEERSRLQVAMRGQKRDSASHIFDGRRVCLDGKVWQVCDITDPLLKSLLTTDHVRATCDHRHDGWYLNGVLSKAKTILREKMRSMIDSPTGTCRPDSDFARILELPDIIDADTKHLAILSKDAASWEVELATEIRTRASNMYSGRKYRDGRGYVEVGMAHIDIDDGDDDEEDDDEEDSDEEDDDDEDEDEDEDGDGDEEDDEEDSDDDSDDEEDTTSDDDSDDDEDTTSDDTSDESEQEDVRPDRDTRHAAGIDTPTASSKMHAPTTAIATATATTTITVAITTTARTTINDPDALPTTSQDALPLT
ncbi:MAG: tau 95 subunit of transcription factor TFIIIC [Phylliscum demangeonii]|nr:MAG: tau 95 subunit of transcription factor TFIIIC [Phylliscum demangeonii]